MHSFVKVTCPNMYFVVFQDHIYPYVLNSMFLMNPLTSKESEVRHFIVKFLPENITCIPFTEIFIHSWENSKIFLHPSIFTSLFPEISKFELSEAKLIGEFFSALKILFIFSFFTLLSTNT